MPVNPRILRLDLAYQAHADHLIALLDHYARDPFGGGVGLTDDVRGRLISGLQATQTYHGALAFDGETPIGLINCFAGFSTFAAQPLLNIHDLVVKDVYRGQGVGQALLAWAERTAIGLGCCKLTLEVLSNNHHAIKSYKAAGYASYQLDPEAGVALLMQKKLG